MQDTDVAAEPKTRKPRTRSEEAISASNYLAAKKNYKRLKDLYAKSEEKTAKLKDELNLAADEVAKTRQAFEGTQDS